MPIFLAMTVNINIKFEMPGIIPQLVDKEVELCFLSTQSLDWMDRISFFFSFKEGILGPFKTENNKIILTRLNFLLFCEFFHNGLINMHRTQCVRFLCVTNFWDDKYKKNTNLNVLSVQGP